MSDDDKSVLGQLRKLVEIEGFQPDTEAYERRMRQAQVTKCRELRGLMTCSECPVFEFCDLTKRVMREHRGYKE